MTDKHSFMEERGILDRESPEYMAADKEYNRLYYRNWRKLNKDKYVIVKIMFRKENFSLVAKEAKDSKLPVATLIFSKGED